MWNRLTEAFSDTLLLAAISLIFCVVKTVVQPSARTLKSYLAAFCVSVPVGILTGYLAQDFGLSDAGVFTATAGASIMAQEIVRTFIKSDGLIQRALENLIDKYTK